MKSLNYKTNKVQADQERLLALELNQKNIMEELQRFNQENKDQHNEILGLVKEMGSKLDLALDKKANKWVEKVIIGVVVFVLTGCATYLGALIVQAMLYLN